MGDSIKILPMAHNQLEEFLFSENCPVLGNSMKTKIPQHKLHGDRIAQK
jgi:hypothetical protein